MYFSFLYVILHKYNTNKKIFCNLYTDPTTMGNSNSSPENNLKKMIENIKCPKKLVATINASFNLKKNLTKHDEDIITMWMQTNDLTLETLSRLVDLELVSGYDIHGGKKHDDNILDKDVHEYFQSNKQMADKLLDEKELVNMVHKRQQRMKEIRGGKLKGGDNMFTPISLFSEKHSEKQSLGAGSHRSSNDITESATLFSDVGLANPFSYPGSTQQSVSEFIMQPPTNTKSATPTPNKSATPTHTHNASVSVSDFSDVETLRDSVNKQVSTVSGSSNTTGTSSNVSLFPESQVVSNNTQSKVSLLPESQVVSTNTHSKVSLFPESQVVSTNTQSKVSLFPSSQVLSTDTNNGSGTTNIVSLFPENKDTLPKYFKQNLTNSTLRDIDYSSVDQSITNNTTTSNPYSENTGSYRTQTLVGGVLTSCQNDISVHEIPSPKAESLNIFNSVSDNNSTSNFNTVGNLDSIITEQTSFNNLPKFNTSNQLPPSKSYNPTEDMSDRARMSYYINKRF